MISQACVKYFKIVIIFLNIQKYRIIVNFRLTQKNSYQAIATFSLSIPFVHFIGYLKTNLRH